MKAEPVKLTLARDLLARGGGIVGLILVILLILFLMGIRMWTIVLIILSILLPPLAAFLVVGLSALFWINLIPTLLGWGAAGDHVTGRHQDVAAIRKAPATGCATHVTGATAKPASASAASSCSRSMA